jgi:hypothetical protein
MAQSQGRPAAKGETKVKREQAQEPKGKPKMGGRGTQRSILANPTVFVFNTAAGFRVRPAYVGAPSSGNLNIKNLTGFPIQVFQPGPWFVNNGSSAAIANGGLVAVPLANVVTIQRQPYVVYVDGPNQFAEGESYPEVIIEP